VSELERAKALVAEFGVQAVLGWLRPLIVEARLAELERVVAARRLDITVLADRFYDPHNNAAVLRSAEAFGLTEIHVVPGEQGAAFASGVSQGVEKWIDYRVHATTEAACAALAAAGYAFVGADLSGVPCEELTLPGRVCLVLGSEKPGLSSVARKRCTAFVTIPMRGMVESFNVSVAAALLLQGLARRPVEALSVDAAAELLARYMVLTIQRPAVVLEELRRRWRP
jgi:tRNA (guanosine-2'-O-)-methyltransferase